MAQHYGTVDKQHTFFFVMRRELETFSPCLPAKEIIV